ncbi:hypothetical protein EVAR_40672_1 [Eumeta japonica]|uniref:Uncharacterized protein n=1 Tax=Eumeta variegata TaxID=151549 RepID=A0A4C1X777_EUMVA|nr:hypothetical protein EVAR_40672_1 [Eumeta japonica]
MDNIEIYLGVKVFPEKRTNATRNPNSDESLRANAPYAIIGFAIAYGPYFHRRAGGHPPIAKRASPSAKRPASLVVAGSRARLTPQITPLRPK